MTTRIAGLLMAFVLLAGCTPSTPPTTNPSTGSQAPTAPQRDANQVFRIGAPSLSTLGPESTLVNFNKIQFDSLLWFDKGFEIKPAAAEKWEILPDFSAWRFTLRKDLTFANGEKLTADDAVFTIQNLLTPAPTNTVGRQLLFASGVKKVDDYTFDITLKQRDYSLPYVSPNIFIVSKKAVDTVGGYKEFIANPKGGGSGPYDYAEGKTTDQVIYKLRTTAHPFRKPTATEIRWRIIPDPNQRVIGIKTGELDAILQVTSPDLADSAKRDGLIVNAETDSYLNVLFNKAQVEGTPLADKRVRLALNYAVDKEAIAKNIYKGYGSAIGQLGAPGSLNYNDSIKPIPFDPAQAKRLLAEAGYPNGFTVRGVDFSNADPIQTAVIQTMQSAHRDIGVTYELFPLEFANYVAVALGQAPRKELISAGGANPNGIFTFSWQFLKCDQPPQVVLWCVQEMDRSLSAAYAEADSARRVQLLKDAAKAWVDDVPMVFLIGNATIVILGPKMQGFVRPTPGYYDWDAVYRIQ